MSDIQPITKDRDMSGGRAKETGKFKTLHVGGRGSVGFKMNKEGSWWGGKTFSSAPTSVDMMGNSTMTGGSFTSISATSIVPLTSSGLNLGTVSTQKLGMYGKTPITQPSSVADSTVDLTSVSTQLNSLLVKLRSIGIIAT